MGQTEGIDRICLDYAYANLQSGNQRQTVDVLKATLSQMKKNKSDFYYVLELYINAKTVFEYVFKQTYAYSVFVVPMSTQTATTCIKIFQEGSGMAKYMNHIAPTLLQQIADAGKDKTKMEEPFKKLQMLTMGYMYESGFVKLLKSVWIRNICLAQNAAVTVRRTFHPISGSLINTANYSLITKFVCFLLEKPSYP